jgi:hypothetical protein
MTPVAIRWISATKIWVLQVRIGSSLHRIWAFTGDETPFVVKGSVHRGDRVPMSVLST